MCIRDSCTVTYFSSKFLVFQCVCVCVFVYPFNYPLPPHTRGSVTHPYFKTTNSLYARHFIEDNHKFINPLEEYEIVKVVNNTVERKLMEELEILKEREKGIDNLINTKN